MISVITRPVSYTSESHAVFIHGRQITVENRSPDLTAEEHAKQYRAIEAELFEIFIKYQDSRSKAAAV